MDFLSENFLLETDAAGELYHGYAGGVPIFDYHTHLPPDQIAQNTRFRNITHLWLEGDHYKWRLMRANGVPERFCTGDAGDREKFGAWIKTVPYTAGNPIYHWAHMELKNYFGIEGAAVGPDTEDEIWSRCNTLLKSDEFRVHGLLRRMKVDVLCTTDDPADTLEHHIEIAEAGTCPARVYPTFRPDRVICAEGGEEFRGYLEQLGETADREIGSYQDLLEVLEARHLFFHSHGCRLSDHALDRVVFHERTPGELEKIFQKKRLGKPLSREEEAGYSTAIVTAVGEMNARRGWTMQLHIGAMRNINTRKFRLLGKDTGFDAIHDGEIASPLARLLDAMERENNLPKTVLYVLNSGNNDHIGALAGCFQGSPSPGKIQIGPAWWFNDHKDGMVRHLTSLAGIGLLSRFVGMLTDSRSFLSFPRHEYFRRILCNVIGGWVENGELPGDFSMLGGLVQDISYNNASNYFNLPPGTT